MELNFLDTYALIEMAKGKNQAFRRFLESRNITTKLNLMELYYVYLREGQKETGLQLYKQFSGICVPLYDEILTKAAELRLEFKKRDLSYTDCIGYLIARKLGIKFVTGDSKMRDFNLLIL